MCKILQLVYEITNENVVNTYPRPVSCDPSRRAGGGAAWFHRPGAMASAEVIRYLR